MTLTSQALWPGGSISKGWTYDGVYPIYALRMGYRRRSKMVTIYCTNCGELKPVSDFHKDSSRVHGIVEECKVCRCARSREHYAGLTDEQKKARHQAGAEAKRVRRKANRSRSLNWERVQHLVILGALWENTAEAADYEAMIEDARVPSAPMSRGGAPASWDAMVEIRSIMRETKGIEVAVAVALKAERLDVIVHVLLPQAEASWEWARRQHRPKGEVWRARREINRLEAEKGVLEKAIEVLHHRPAYNGAMEFMARKFYARGIR